MLWFTRGHSQDEAGVDVVQEASVNQLFSRAELKLAHQVELPCMLGLTFLLRFIYSVVGHIGRRATEQQLPLLQWVLQVLYIVLLAHLQLERVLRPERFE